MPVTTQVLPVAGRTCPQNAAMEIHVHRCSKYFTILILHAQF
jgi:hypothetical protein